MQGFSSDIQSRQRDRSATSSREWYLHRAVGRAAQSRAFQLNHRRGYSMRSW